MKTNLLIPVALALLALPIAATQAATLTITGRVLPGTCTLATPTIPLDPVKANEMTAATPANLKAGAVNFTGCVGVVRARLSFDGTAADGDPQRWKNTATTSAASGVSIALLKGSSGLDYLKKGDTNIPVTVSGATASYPIRAGYYVPSTSGINAGNIAAEITITAAYD
ncbi:fimbrial protein [Stenotrophomonas sp. S39]|uniref:fimbrial protein n=1 Tax=Stenotrophomonas sp. S39 TaxID=2767451 RepID=UPI00190E3233|nr:fimbrial protein [Stenotrophomonas sp. S39]MBK0055245.1 fimbrial protein [Stenotrophomonas sp. S39]